MINVVFARRFSMFQACRRDNSSQIFDGFVVSEPARLFDEADPESIVRVSPGFLVLHEPDPDKPDGRLLVWSGSRYDFERSDYRFVGFPEKGETR